MNNRKYHTTNKGRFRYPSNFKLWDRVTELISNSSRTYKSKTYFLMKRILTTN